MGEEATAAADGRRLCDASLFFASSSFFSHRRSLHLRPAVAFQHRIFSSLHWRLIGPFRGGRALAVTGVPGDPNHFYFGAVDGGVWESLDAGRTWNPIFDDQDIGSIGVDCGRTEQSTHHLRRDGRSRHALGHRVRRRHVQVDRRRTQLDAYRAARNQTNRRNRRSIRTMRTSSTPRRWGIRTQRTRERGVFKTTDGGKSWTKVLYKGPDVGATALAMAPDDPNVIYAALWQTRRPPWNVYPPSNGPGSGLYKTTDGGATWTQLTNGLPAHVGRIGLSIFECGTASYLCKRR